LLWTGPQGITGAFPVFLIGTVAGNPGLQVPAGAFLLHFLNFMFSHTIRERMVVLLSVLQLFSVFCTFMVFLLPLPDPAGDPERTLAAVML
jgi:hypothetical protein